MNIIKIAILVLIATLMIIITRYFVRKKSENKKIYLIYGGIAITAGILIFLFAFPSYIFISWNKVVVEAGILFVLIGFCLGPPSGERTTTPMFFVSAIITGTGFLAIILISTIGIWGTTTIVNEENNAIKINPTVDVINHTPTIGCLIDESGNETYFYYYSNKDTLYKDVVSNDYKIHELTSEEDSYVLKSMKTVSYTYSEKRI